MVSRYTGKMQSKEHNDYYVYWTLHHCDSWRIKDQLDVTCYFISLLMCSTCFGHYYIHHQELATILLNCHIGRIVLGSNLCPDAMPNEVFHVSYQSPNQTYGYYLQLSHDHFLWRSLKLITHYHPIVQRHRLWHWHPCKWIVNRYSLEE